MNASNISSDTYVYDYHQYEDYDYSQIPYQGVIKQVPAWEIAIKSLFYAIIMVPAIAGNIMVILVVFRNARMRTTTNYYIVNLAVSDILVTMSCSWVHLVNSVTSSWVLGSFFCKFNSFAQVLSLVASILTLTLIACDRFFGIVFAMKAHVMERRARYSLVMVWIFSMAVAAPLLFVRKLHIRVWYDFTERFCNDEWSALVALAATARLWYYTVVSVVLYFVPIVVMAVAYSVIIWKLWSRRAPGEILETEMSVQDKLKRKVIAMLITILCLFVLCWLPFQITILYTEHKDAQKLPYWFSDFHYFALYLAYANSAMNPLIYAGFNANFKKGFRDLLVCVEPRRYSAVESHQESFHSSTIVTKV